MKLDMPATVEGFETVWLNGEMPIERYEVEYLSVDLAFYYKLKTTILRALDLFDPKIKACGLFQWQDRQILKDMKELFGEVWRSMKGREFFAFLRLYEQERYKDLRTIESVVNDKELQTLRSAIRLCDYSIVREKAPYEVLSKFTYEDYLRKYNEYELLERLGYEEEKV